MKIKNKNVLKDLVLQINAMNTIQGGVAATSVNVSLEEGGQILEVQTPSIAMEAYNLEVHNHILKIDIHFPKYALNDATPIMTRVFPLPSSVDTEKIEATFDNNSLRVFLPQKDASKQHRKIDIKYPY